jgi:predicted ester cyclase
LKINKVTCWYDVRIAGYDLYLNKNAPPLEVKTLHMKKFSFLLLIASCTFTTSMTAQELSKGDIPIPESVTVDKSLSPAAQKAAKAATFNFYAFWNTGRKYYLDKAVSSDFIDHTLPEGRPQGPKGPVYASANFRKAVPDLRCEVKDILIAGDKVTVRMVFKGTHKGEFMGQKPTGKSISFFAIDILHIKNGKIFEDWHLEDNLALLKQLGVVK